jgi:hypothetical protein
MNGRLFLPGESCHSQKQAAMREAGFCLANVQSRHAMDAHF